MKRSICYQFRILALQMQQQWSHSVNGFLLASGANNPAVGSGGSGIYQGM